MGTITTTDGIGGALISGEEPVTGRCQPAGPRSAPFFIKDLFGRNRRRAAEHILEDIPLEDGGAGGPEPGSVEREYRGIFGLPSPLYDREISDYRPEVPLLEEPISIEEIGSALAKVRSNAVGPDGIKLSSLKR